MFGSVMIDIVVGLVFTYLLLSLIVTAVQEVIESIIKLRAAHLAKGIEKLLGSDKATEFFDNPVIKAMSPDKWRGAGTRKPSYIEPRAFATAVLDLIVRAETAGPRTIEQIKAGIEKLPAGDLKKSLTILLDEAGHKMDEFQQSLEHWFDAQMDRVSGWYKRKVQVITVAVGLVITIGMDADTVRMVRTLSQDSTLRASLVAQAPDLPKQS